MYQKPYTCTKINVLLHFSDLRALILQCNNQRWSQGHKARGQGQGHKKIRGQGQPFRGQTLSRPRTGMLEAKAKDTSASALQKEKKVFTKICQAISTKKRFSKNFSSAPQNFNNSKNSAVLEPRTDQFSRTRGFEAKPKNFKMCP